MEFPKNLVLGTVSTFTGVIALFNSRNFSFTSEASSGYISNEGWGKGKQML